MFIGMFEALWKSLTCQASATGETAECEKRLVKPSDLIQESYAEGATASGHPGRSEPNHCAATRVSEAACLREVPP